MFKQLLLSNMDIRDCDKDYRRLLMVNVIFIAANAVYMLFTVINFLREDYAKAWLDLLFVFPALYGYIELRYKKNIQRASTYAILLLFFTMLIVLFIFRAEHYTMLWTLLFAFVATMLKGAESGLRYMIVFYTITYLAAYQWIGENILLSEYTRFVAVSLVVIGVAYFYEKGISKALSRLNTTNQQLHELNENLEARVEKGVEELRAKDQLVIQTAKNAAMGEMIGAISHQWKQPLSALALYLQELKDANQYGELDTAYIENLSAKSMKQIHYMSQTIDDFKNFLEPEKKKETFLIHTSIDHVLEILNKQLLNASITVNFNYEEIPIESYRGELEQVILNLINNAKDELVRKSTDNRAFSPLIDIRVEHRQGRPVIYVSDNGDGIPEESLPKIFESYFTTKKKNIGTGIGLYISKMIVERSLNGTLTAQNSQDGGAVFQISL